MRQPDKPFAESAVIYLVAQAKPRRYRIFLLVFLLVLSLLIGLFAVIRCTRDADPDLSQPTSGQTTDGTTSTSTHSGQTTLSTDLADIDQAEIAEIDNFGPSDYAQE
ncbi:MAG: hypothetical protein SCM11_07985 [Bacillota bacterium]|nr:hypothetical protein [Bacillota bacterium]